jgi:hypothetical protein
LSCRYCRQPLEVSAINDDKNILILRKDLHHLFDMRRFAFVPKQFGTSEPVELVMHVLLPLGSPDIVGLYHNRCTQPIRGVSVECLFAHFAWALFTDEHMPFLGSDLKYAVRLWDKDEGKAETRTLGGLEVRSIAHVFEPIRSQSRSVSPKKRSHSTQGGHRDKNSYDDNDDDGDSVDEILDEPSRGRPRKRSWEALGHDDEQVPSLSCSFASGTDSSLASSTGSRVSHSLTLDAVDTAPLLISAGDSIDKQRPQKRIHVEEKPGEATQVDING